MSLKMSIKNELSNQDYTLLAKLIFIRNRGKGAKDDVTFLSKILCVTLKSFGWKSNGVRKVLEFLE